MPTLNKIIKEVQELIDSSRAEAYNIAITDVISLLLGMKGESKPKTYIVCKLESRYRPCYKTYNVNNGNYNFSSVINDKYYMYLGQSYSDAMKAQVKANRCKQ